MNCSGREHVSEPGANHSYEIPVRLWGGLTTPYYGKPPVEIRFTDTSGRSWHRLSRGQLVDLGLDATDPEYRWSENQPARQQSRWRRKARSTT
jgi:hypothetical protein